MVWFEVCLVKYPARRVWLMEFDIVPFDLVQEFQCVRGRNNNRSASKIMDGIPSFNLRPILMENCPMINLRIYDVQGITNVLGLHEIDRPIQGRPTAIVGGKPRVKINDPLRHSRKKSRFNQLKRSIGLIKIALFKKIKVLLRIQKIILPVFLQLRFMPRKEAPMLITERVTELILRVDRLEGNPDRNKIGEIVESLISQEGLVRFLVFVLIYLNILKMF